MSKKKSLGSSPIGFQSKSSTMQFIPDLGVSKSKSRATPSQTVNKTAGENTNEKSSNKSPKQDKPKKKIVSYNLEIGLIENVKSMANEKGMYYSSLVSTALKSWMAENA